MGKSSIDEHFETIDEGGCDYSFFDELFDKHFDEHFETTDVTGGSLILGSLDYSHLEKKKISTELMLYRDISALFLGPRYWSLFVQYCKETVELSDALCHEEFYAGIYFSHDELLAHVRVMLLEDGKPSKKRRRGTPMIDFFALILIVTYGLYKVHERLDNDDKDPLHASRREEIKEGGFFDMPWFFASQNIAKFLRGESDGADTIATITALDLYEPYNKNRE